MCLREFLSALYFCIWKYGRTMAALESALLPPREEIHHLLATPDMGESGDGQPQPTRRARSTIIYSTRFEFQHQSVFQNSRYQMLHAVVCLAALYTGHVSGPRWQKGKHGKDFVAL